MIEAVLDHPATGGATVAFRIQPRVGRADGLGFALLNTGAYGNTGGTCPTLEPFAVEEGRFRGSLGIGFDTHRADDGDDLDANHVSVAFDGALIRQVSIPPGELDLAGGGWIHALVAVEADADGGGRVTVVLTPAGGAPWTVVNRLRVSRLRWYEARALFGGRSGGQAADLDNVAVRFLDAPGPGAAGRWSAPFRVLLVPIHAHLLPTGSVMFWNAGELQDNRGRLGAPPVEPRHRPDAAGGGAGRGQHLLRRPPIPGRRQAAGHRRAARHPEHGRHRPGVHL